MSAPLRIGVVCYPTYGGSGVIATEVGMAMAELGHEVHFIGYDEPRRLRPGPRVTFHGVEVRDYPVFHHPPYLLALASKLVEVATWSGLDLVHVHYAIPHAAAAVMARDVLVGEGRVRPPKILTTLHGTDITVVGSDPSYLPLTRHGLLMSDAVTVPSHHLERETRARLGLPDLPIQVIPNFVDIDRFRPLAEGPPDLDAPRFVHVSNFRSVKRVPDLVAAFAAVRAELPHAELTLVGDGPERSRAESLARSLGLGASVRFLGRQDALTELLSGAAAFVLPSETESFGVAALEAMACGVPVVATDVGGLPEVVVDGESGLLVPSGDVARLAGAMKEIVRHPERWQRMAEASRARAVHTFRREEQVGAFVALAQALVVR
jgi:N-acetyl-alpha-D-glucosaminyl L-malate synthase BshA